METELIYTSYESIKIELFQQYQQLALKRVISIRAALWMYKHFP
ncbi:hypothetical protein DFP78_106242 [Photobacterium lutimaris]|nr:hypothetical protein DFP78_106242 [Photobacterium lutimaris]